MYYAVLHGSNGLKWEPKETLCFLSVEKPFLKSINASGAVDLEVDETTDVLHVHVRWGLYSKNDND